MHVYVNGQYLIGKGCDYRVDNDQVLFEQQLPKGSVVAIVQNRGKDRAAYLIREDVPALGLWREVSEIIALDW